MVKKENRSVLRTKKLLYDNLIILLKRKPITHVTVKELTDMSNLNRGTFYLYYQDIYDLVSHIENEIIIELSTLLSPINVTRPIDILEPLFTYLYEHGDMTLVLISDHGDISFLSKLVKIVKEFCYDDWKEVFKINNEEIYEMYFNYVSAGFLSICEMWYKNKQNKSPHEIAFIVEKIILSDISSL